MKRSLLLFTSLLILFTACKKGGDNNASDATHIANLQANILGTWYYKDFNVAYFHATTVFLYNEGSTAKSLHDASPFQFNSDGTGSYEGKSFTYKITSTAGADSVIMTGTSTSRFSIVSLTKSQFKFTSTYPAVVTFQNTSDGELIVSNIAQSSGTLIRTQAP